jgi:hypothetical protein
MKEPYEIQESMQHRIAGSAFVYSVISCSEENAGESSEVTSLTHCCPRFQYQ